MAEEGMSGTMPLYLRRWTRMPVMPERGTWTRSGRLPVRREVSRDRQRGPAMIRHRAIPDRSQVAYRPDREPLPYVGLHRWDYPGLARTMGFGNAVSVATEADLDKALSDARAWDGPGLISALVSPRDLPPENQ